MHTDIAPAPDLFALLAAEFGARSPQADVDWSLGSPPRHITKLFGHCDNVILFRPRDAVPLKTIRAAALAIPPEAYQDRNSWRDLILPLAHEAVERPEREPEMRALAHEVSRQEGAWDRHTFPSGYDASANDVEFDIMMADTERRLARDQEVRGVGSLLHFARQRGWQESQNAFVAGPLPIDAASMHITASPTKRTKRKMLLGGLAIIGHISIIVSPGGLAKSTIATAGCIALSSGRPIFGAPEMRPMPVLMINAEDDSGEVRLRCDAVLAHHQRRPRMLANSTSAVPTGWPTLPSP